MNKKPCKRVLASIELQAWAIRPEMLTTLLSIAQRQYSNPIEASEISERYRASGAVDKPSTIAVIDVTGPIFAHADYFTDISGSATCEGVAAAIDAAIEATEITGIILRFDSPGGEVTGTHELANHIYQMRDIKPIVAYVSGSACSGAYWLASATSYIFTDRTAMLGSIGVVAAWTDNSAAREKVGLVDYEVVSSQSPNKRLDPGSDSGRAALQRELDGLADIFISDVALFRGVSPDVVQAEFGQGGTLLADAAIRAGMADELGSLRDVVAILSTESDAVAETQRGNTMAGFIRNTASAKTDDEPEKKPDEEVTDPDDKQEPPTDAPEDEGDETSEPIEDEEDLEAEEDDKSSETTATHRQLKKFAVTHPSVYRAILRRGARRERRRIEAIEGLSAQGREDVIQAAKFDSPKTVGATSREILRVERLAKVANLNDFRSDAGFRAPQTAGTGGAQADVSATAEKTALEQIRMGAKTKLGARKQ